MNALKSIILVALGGGIGSVSRFLISSAINKWSTQPFLWGTLSVNVLGSLAVGILWAFFDVESSSQNLKIFLIIGILGGFTTFSSFSLEVINLFKSGELRVAILYIIATNIFSIAAAFGGYLATKHFL